MKYQGAKQETPELAPSQSSSHPLFRVFDNSLVVRFPSSPKCMGCILYSRGLFVCLLLLFLFVFRVLQYCLGSVKKHYLNTGKLYEKTDYFPFFFLPTMLLF